MNGLYETSRFTRLGILCLPLIRTLGLICAGTQTMWH